MYNFLPFSGSYLPDDVQFLLRPVTIDMTPVELTEQLIQSGQKHYSDMLSQEPAPTDWHLDLFNRALKKGAPRLARDVNALARTLGDYFADQPVVLVSLVRAGVPLGVMLHKSHTITASVLSAIAVLIRRRWSGSNTITAPPVLCLLTAGQVKAPSPVN